MKALQVNFARPPRWPARLAYGLSAALCALGIWQGVVAAHGYEALLGERGRSADLQRQLDRTMKQANAPVQVASAPAYDRDARALARTSGFDVGSVLHAIESVQILGVKATNVDIDAETRTVELTLDVTSADVATIYVQALNTVVGPPVWTLVRLQAKAGGDTAQVRGQFP